MLSIILVQNGTKTSTLSDLVNQIKQLEGTKEIVLVCDSDSPAAIAGTLEVAAKGRSTASALEEAARLATSARILVIDARLGLDEQTFKQTLVRTINERREAFLYVPWELGEQSIELSESSVDSVVSNIATLQLWPMQWVLLDRAFFIESKPLGNSLTSAMAHAYIYALSQNEEIGSLETSISLDSDVDQDIFRLSDRERSLLLEYAVSACNIEELFPNHAWNEHKEESAAASYHSLAALFVRLGNVASARECLTLGDQFEDSPRSLALKGLIALDRGEMLGAVANMVSSLQQYELRKRNDGTHYLTFAPKDLEKINSRLSAGLQALNKQDNKTAFGFFAEAVFDFDDFYVNHGIARKL